MSAVLVAAWFVMPPWWGITLAIVVVVLGGVIATSLSSPNFAAVGVTPDDRLLVRPVGLVRMWALHSGIDVPVTAITDVGVAARSEIRARGLRAPGTNLPGVMVAGTFRARDGKELWMAGRAPTLLVIDLHDEAHRRLVIQVEDPEAATEALRAAMNRER